MAVTYPFDISYRCDHSNQVTFYRTIGVPLDDFSFAMDVEVALPSGNIGDEPKACGNTRKGFDCAAPEYAIGNKKVGRRGGVEMGVVDMWPIVFACS